MLPTGVEPMTLILLTSPDASSTEPQETRGS